MNRRLRFKFLEDIVTGKRYGLLIGWGYEEDPTWFIKIYW